MFIDNHKIEKLKREIKEEKIKELLPIIKKLEEYTIEENLITVYKNLSSVSLKKMPTIFSILSPLKGLYEPRKNKIIYGNSTIGHEFLHMSSAYYNEKTNEIYSGFSQIKEDASIGNALDEGYTELLAFRIYNKNNKVSTYFREVEIASLFELFFENPKDMEKFYFNHNLPGFIHYMENFATKQEIIEFLLKLDSISYLGNHTILPVSFSYIKLQLKLYSWFRVNIDNEVRLKQFEDLICKNKIISMILSDRNMKLYKENLCNNQDLLSSSEIQKSKHYKK